MNCLFVRLDKIGDLIATMCCDQHPVFKKTNNYWVISKGLDFIPNHSVPKRNFSSISKNWQGFKELRNILRANKFELSISFQSPWWVSLLVWHYGIPHRFGVQSKWHSFLFLNKAIRQKRSLSVMHEADYNYDLVKAAAKHISATLPKPNDITQNNSEQTPILKLNAPLGLNILIDHGLKSKKYIVVHPGMAGSARNWPQKKFSEFICTYQNWCLHNNLPSQIVLTGTHSDSPFIKEIIQHLPYNCKNLVGQLNSEQLLDVLSQAALVMAPSTGILHLASSLGTPTISFFSPIAVQSVTRWGPRGSHNVVYSPSVTCPATHHCLNKNCIKYDCMEKIELTDNAYNLIKESLLQ